ncbi:hypothetical protein PLICRDRAFT_53082 [Plicaturopsis crispa FD-325 SS-3]|nr:hypothetical protein PLICRDRAFT_53082 [Plicaturopsis crispa FD-325 SS-3]
MSTLRLIWPTFDTTCLLYSPTIGQDFTATISHTIRGDSRVHIATVNTSEALIYSDQTDIIVKIATGKEGIKDLEREAGFYESDLRPLQGSVVPRCYGFFKGKVSGEYQACLLLEFCRFVEHQPSFKRTLVETNRLKMVAAARLHQVGIIHNDLIDGRHFVIANRGPQIIDFTYAERHACRGAVPLLLCDNVPRGCWELVNMERYFGDTDGAHAKRAVKSDGYVPMDEKCTVC